jgi:hypothetical protein
MIGLHSQVVPYPSHGEGRGAAKKVAERTLMLRIEMLHEHEPHAGVERQMLEHSVNASRPPAEASMPTIGHPTRSAVGLRSS